MKKGIFCERQRISVLEDRNRYVGPDGDSSPASSAYPLPGRNVHALIGRIGSTIFYVGSSFSGTAPASGTLELGMNDSYFSDNAGSLTVTISTDNQPPTTYTLSVSKSGSGTVTSDLPGINCGSDCSESYSSGTSVTLTATPDSGWTFSGWGGACSGTGATCTVSMTSDKSVSATFSRNSSQAPVLIVPGILASYSSRLFNTQGNFPWDLPIPNCVAELTDNWVINPFPDRPDNFGCRAPAYNASLHPYETLINEFINAGYQPERTLFIVPYDWRKSNAESAVNFLIPAIERAKRARGSSKVNIVAHSMGGLVARYYIQNLMPSRGHDVNKLAMLATPNRGAAAYAVWEGGEFDNWDLGGKIFYLNPLIKTMKEQYNEQNLRRVDFIQRRIPSVKELLPTTNFLFNTNGQIIPISMMRQQNTFLRDLNNNLGNLAGVDIRTYAGTTGETIAGYTVEPSQGGGPTELIQNGGFETGGLSPRWNVPDWGRNQTPVVINNKNHSGNYSVLLGHVGGSETAGWSVVYQLISIPSDANAPYLSFWYWPFTADTTDTAGDIQGAWIYGNGGFHNVMLVRQNDQRWIHKAYDLSAFKGQQIIVL